MTDYIDRQAAIDAVQQHREAVLGSFEYDEGIAIGYAAAHNHIAEVIERLPSAEVEPIKHGRWVPVTNGRGGFECSICHSYAPSYQDGVECLSPWCPFCGAKMDKEGEA